MAKEIIKVDLNYIHSSLSPRTRTTTLIIGIAMITAGSWGVYGNHTDLLSSGFVNSVINIVIGIGGLLFSMRHLPDFAKKYIRLSENSIKFKKHWFFPRRKFVWDDIDKIEITRENVKITTDYSNKVKVFDLSSVSYEDYDLLHKSIVDTCLERNIDMI